MPTKNDLLKEINKRKNNAKAELLYAKGLTKMKKDELIEVLEKMKRSEGKEAIRLQRERDNLEDEIDDLEDQQEQKKVEIEELEYSEDKSSSDESEDSEDEKPNAPNAQDETDEEIQEETPENTQEYTDEDIQEYTDEDIDEEIPEKPPLVRQNAYILSDESESEKSESDAEEFLQKIKSTIKKHEVKQPVRPSKKDLENEIKGLMSSFGDSITDLIKPYQRKKRYRDLPTYDVDEIIDTHNDLRENIRDKIDIVMDDLPDNDDFSEAFYRYVNNYFERQLNRVDKLIR